MNSQNNVMNLSLYNMTEFQLRWCLAKEREENFDQWIVTRSGKKRSQGKLLMGYFTLDGKFHSVLLGMQRVIAEAHQEGSDLPIVPKDEADREFVITARQRQPGQTWNEKHVRIECFLQAYARNYSYDPDKGSIVAMVPAQEHEAAKAYLQEHGFSYVTGGKSL